MFLRIIECIGWFFVIYFGIAAGLAAIGGNWGSFGMFLGNLAIPALVVWLCRRKIKQRKAKSK